MNKLFKNTSFYTIGNILPRIGSFLLIPVYTDYLEPAEYGKVYSLQVIASVMSIFFTLSLPKSIYRLYYDHKTIDEKKTFVSSVINTVFIASIFFFTLTIIFNDYVSMIYEGIDFFPYFLFILVYALFNSFETVPKSLLQVKEKAKVYVLVNFSQFVLQNCFVVLFVVYLGYGAEGYLLGQMLSAVILAPILLYMIRDYLSLRWDWDIIKKTLSFSLPMIPATLSALVLNLSDRVFIERYFSTSEVGIYSLGYQIAGLALIFSMGVKTALDPYFYNVTNELSYLQAKERLSKELKNVIYLILFVVFFIALFSKEVIVLFVDERYWGASEVVPIISLAYLINHFSGYFNLMMYQQKKSVVVMYIILFGAVLNIILNYILVPIQGVFGAAWATVISFFIIVLLQEFISRKYYYIPLRYGGVIIFSVIGALIVFLFNFYLDMNIYMSTIIKVTILLIASGIFYVRYKAEILRIVKMKLR